jgi:hypothetical protein
VRHGVGNGLLELACDGERGHGEERQEQDEERDKDGCAPAGAQAEAANEDAVWLSRGRGWRRRGPVEGFGRSAALSIGLR